MTKVAVSIPDEMFRSLQRARTAKTLSRSAAVQQALRAWLADARRRQMASDYVEAYRRLPEVHTEIAAWEAAESWSSARWR
jgi:metal-responsive CopG/Arc/MetJ family transcriptional regulator